jgi:hypothetical protein
MSLRSPESLIAALLKNELTWDDFQTAFRSFNQRERIVILERLDAMVSKGTGQEKS